ncbi:MAG: metal ABC transporter ATP-binding protein [Ruminococcaceae bacterium]|nr:metal ABC transporter ATP-binding protein [Oscillospiraceae bacterium]
MSLISCRNVCLSYENNIVVDNLSFNVEAGDYLCIVGENGSGKSTLVKAALGLKETTSGHLHFGEGLKKGEIGYLPQQTTAQKDFPASVFEVVISGCSADKKGIFYSKSHKKLAYENMKKLDIISLEKKCFRELSGGQQQRVLLARALCATKKLILLDEPVTGLDPVVTNELYSIISAINKELGITIVMVSHDLHSAIDNASHILHLNKNAHFFGTVEKYLLSDIYKSFSGGAAND